MVKKMLIDATHPEETRVVVADGNKVEDFDFESLNKRQLAGNIYLAKVTRVEPSLQAAFVEYGGNRHGFLAFPEIHPDYYQIPVADREALLAAEAREEEAERAREDEQDSPKPKRSRTPSKRTRKPRQNSVSGLEVIDVDGADDGGDGASGAVPRGLEVAESGAEPEEESAAAAPATAKGEDVPSGEADKAPADAAPATGDAPAGDGEGAADAAAPEAGADQTADETTDAAADGAGDEAADQAGATGEEASDAKPPRSIAESAGLGEDERLTGDVPEDGDRTAAEDEASAEASRPDDITADPAAPANEDATAEPADTPEGADEAAEAEPAAAIDDGESADSGEAAAEVDGAASAEAATDAAGSSDTGDDAGGTGHRRRRRRRRSDHAKSADADDAANGAGGEASGSGKAAASGGKPARDDSHANGNGNGDDNHDGPADQPDEIGADDAHEEASRTRARLRRHYKIQDVVKVRQIMLVQVVKEERGNKGAALTTYLSLAGRYCVLMPNTARGGGISRKITNATDRKRLRAIAGELDVPRGMGLIVRTAGAERTRAEIKRDYEFLLRQWEQIRDLTLKSVAPTLIYEEGSLIKRSIRDLYSKEIDQVLVEGEAGYREAKEYMKMLMPSHAKFVQPYAEPIPLFGRYQIESYLNGMFDPKVQLKSGGYIVIDITEALVAIDVNSGKATKQGSIEETALQTNLEAAEEVARQLRLRDLAGLIVIDFIDMDENRNNRAVEKRLKDRLKSDRARLQLGRISAFGLLEMSRQRLRPGMLEATTRPCPHCHGVGLIRSDDSLSLAILREVEEEALRGRSTEITVRAPVAIANYIVNAKRLHIGQIESRNGVSVLIVGDPELISPDYAVERAKGERKRPAPAARDVVSSATAALPDEDDATAATNGNTSESSRDDAEEDGSRRRRRRRGGRRRRSGNGEERGQRASDAENRTENGNDDAGNAGNGASTGTDAEATAAQADAGAGGGNGGGDNRGQGDEGRSRSRRSRSRRQSQRSTATDEATAAEGTPGDVTAAAPAADGTDATPADAAPAGDTQAGADAATAGQPEATAADDAPAAAAADDEDVRRADAFAEAVGSAVEPADAVAEPPEAQEAEDDAAATEADGEAARSAAPQPEADPRPKKRGWWSLGF